MLRVVTDDDASAEMTLALDEICREGARRMLTAALEAERDAYLALFAEERDVRFVASIVNRAVMAFAGATLGVMSVVLLAIRGGPALIPGAAPGSGTSVFRLFGYLGLFFSVVLILRVVIAIAREGISPP